MNRSVQSDLADLNLLPGRPNVLICAYALSPQLGSECAVGWNLCLQLAQYFNITVLYADHDHSLAFRAHVEDYFQLHGPVPGLSCIAVPHTRMTAVLERLHNAGLWFVYYWGYKSWQKQALIKARSVISGQSFALVHQLNMIGFRAPGYLWQLGLPYLWGPVGGASSVPWSFLWPMGLRGKLFYGARNLLNALDKRFRPGPRAAARAASLILAANHDNQRMVQQHFGRYACLCLESAAQPGPAKSSFYQTGQTLQLSWSGNHNEGKALPLLLHALARIKPRVNFSLVVLGDGPETHAWQRLARALQLSENIRWCGRLPHVRALATVAGSDLFIFTSLLEGTPHVVLEALSRGVPVICHDACGMAAVVTNQCGSKIPLQSPEHSVAGFAAQIEACFLQPQLLRQWSAGASARAAGLSWKNKALELADYYQQIIYQP